MKRYLDVALLSLQISIKKTRAYRLEMFMMLLHFLFALSFITFLWTALSDIVELHDLWNREELYVYSSLVIFADGVGELFFPLYSLPRAIVKGDLNMYLIRPINALYLYILVNLNIIAVVEQLIISSLSFLFIVRFYNLSVHLDHIPLAFIMIVIGAISYHLYYAAFSLLTFWMGDISIARDAMYGISDLKKYPVDLFNVWVRRTLTYVIPLSLLVYYPTCILIRNDHLHWSVVVTYALVLLFGCIVVAFVWIAGLKRYEANS